MKIRTLYAALLLLAFVGATALVFPTKSTLISLYQESGNIKASKALMDALTEHKKQGATESFEYLVKTAQIYHLLGDPDNAIGHLEQAVALKPRNYKALRLLATYYTWNMSPNKAMATYATLARHYPRDVEVLEELIGFYRHFKMEEKEKDAIATLIPLIQAKPAQHATAFLDIIWSDLARLAAEQKSSPDTTLQRALMRRLYNLSLQYQAQVRNSRTVNTPQLIIFAIENYISTNQYEAGLALASRLDERLDQGIENRLRMAQVFEWNGIYRPALEIVQKLKTQAPDDKRLLLATLRLAKQLKETDTVKATASSLASNTNLDARSRRELAGLYEDSEEYDKAIRLYSQLIVEQNLVRRHLKKLLETALYSGKAEHLQLAASMAEKYGKSTGSTTDKLLARVYLAQGRAKAARPLVLALAQRPRNTTPETFGLLLRIAAATGDMTLAQKARDMASNIPGFDTPAMQRELADAYLAANQPEAALPILEALAQASQSDQRSDKLVELMTVAQYTDKPKLMAKASQLALKLEPNEPLVLLGAAQTYLAAGLGKEALPLLKQYFKGRRPPVSDEELDVLFLTAANADNPAVALQALDLATTLRPGSPDVRRRMADALLAGNNPKEAYAIYKDLVEMGSRKDLKNMLETASYTADAAIMQQAAQAGQTRLGTPVAKNMDLWRIVANLYLWSNNSEQAAALFAALSDNAPGDAELALLAGQAYGAAAQNEQADIYFERALALRPTAPEIIRPAALQKGYAGDFKGQIRLFEALRQQAPLSTEDQLVLGRAYADNGQYTQALEELAPLRQKTELTKDEGLLLAFVYANADKQREAGALYRRLSQQYASDPEYLSQLGYTAMASADLKSASSLFDRTLRKDATNSKAMKGRAMVLAATNDPHKAIRQYKRYLRKYPDDPEAHYRLAELLSILGRRTEAKKHYDATQQLLSQRPLAEASSQNTLPAGGQK